MIIGQTMICLALHCSPARLRVPPLQYSPAGYPAATDCRCRAFGTGCLAVQRLVPAWRSRAPEAADVVPQICRVATHSGLVPLSA